MHALTPPRCALWSFCDTLGIKAAGDRPGNARMGHKPWRIGRGTPGLWGRAWNTMRTIPLPRFNVTQVPVSAYDNAKAIDQMEAAYSTLLGRPVQGGTTAAYKPSTAAFALDGIEHPRLVTLGGDHTIVRISRC